MSKVTVCIAKVALLYLQALLPTASFEASAVGFCENYQCEAIFLTIYLVFRRSLDSERCQDKEKTQELRFHLPLESFNGSRGLFRSVEVKVRLGWNSFHNQQCQVDTKKFKIFKVESREPTFGVMFGK